jgi:hypothetical protein
VQRRNLFQDSNFPKSYLPQIRGSSWHKNEIKMIRRGYYSSSNFQDSNKRKITEKKTLGYLPRVLFFNAFELGAKSGNQVISSDEALRSIAKSFQQGIVLYPNEFLKIPYEHSWVHSFHQKGFQDKSNQKSFPKLHAILQVCKVLVL